MTEEVLVRITGIQRPEQQPEQNEEPISVVTSGRFYTENGHRYVTYEEIYDEAELSAINTVRITPEILEVKKDGAVNVQMVFQENRKTVSIYGTPFGEIEMGIATTRYGFDETEDLIRLDVCYILEMNGEHAADCELHMEIFAKGSQFSL